MKLAGALLLSVALILSNGAPVSEKKSSCFRDKMDDEVKCTGCKGIVDFLKLVLKLHVTMPSIESSARSICKLFDIEDPTVCSGVVNVFGTQSMYVLNKTDFDTSEICYSLVGAKCGSNAKDLWSIPVPKPTVPITEDVSPIPPDAPLMEVLHLSDLHFDLLYKQGTNAHCDQPLCCRNGQPAKGQPGAGRWGDYKCDMPMDAVDFMFAHIARAHPNIKHIIWTGDLTPHDIWVQTRQGHLAYFDTLLDKMKRFFPKLNTYSTMGNHETVPVNSFPGPEETRFNISWLYDKAAKTWIKMGVPIDQDALIRYGSYYSVQIQPGLRLISINTNYCNNQNFWLWINEVDPTGHLKWLIDQLLDAEKKGDKVHIIGHIPPGVDECLRGWSWVYYSIAERFRHTITAQFFGHTHKDEFQIYYNANLTEPVGVAYLGPSATPFEDVNPSYRIYHIDAIRPKATFKVVNHETYYMNLTKANIGDNKPEWGKLYDARSEFSLPSLEPKEWNKLLERFETDDQIFQRFYQLRSRLKNRSVSRFFLIE